MFKSTVKGTVNKFWTKNLSELRQKEGSTPVTSLKFSTTFDAYGVDKKVENYTDAEVAEAVAEIKAKDKWPTDRDNISFVNDRAKQAARQAAMLKVVTDAGFIQPTLQEDEGLRLGKFRATLRASYPDLPDSVIDVMAAEMLKMAATRAAEAATEETEETETA